MCKGRRRLSLAVVALIFFNLAYAVAAPAVSPTEAFSIEFANEEELIELGSMWMRSDPDRAIEVLSALLEREPPAADELRIQAYFHLGMAYYFKQFHVRSLVNLESALDLVERQPESYGEAQRDFRIRLHNNLGVIHDLLRNHDQAIQQYSLALDLETSRGNAVGMAEVHNNISLVYYSLGQHDDSLAELALAQALITEVDAPLLQGLVLQNQAINYQATGLFEEMMAAYEAAMGIYVEIDAHLNHSQMIYNLALDHLDRTQDLAAAEALIAEGLLLANRHDLVLQRAHLKLLDGRRLLQEGNIAAALDRFGEAEEGFVNSGLGFEHFPDAFYLNRIEAFSALGDRGSVMEAVGRMRRAASERDMAAQRLAVNQLKTELEFNENQNLLQARTIELRARQARANQLLFVTILLLTLLVAGALHYRTTIRNLKAVYALNQRELVRLREAREASGKEEGSEGRPRVESPVEGEVSSGEGSTSSGRGQRWIYNKAERVMQQDAMFKQSGLTLAAFAEKLAVSPRMLSESINYFAEKSFNEYVNKYRILHAMTLLEQPQHSHLSVDQVVADCGFTSRSTFYAAFKRECSMTPRQYRMMAIRRQVEGREKAGSENASDV